MNARDFSVAMILLNLRRTAMVFLAGAAAAAIALLVTHGTRWHVPDPAMAAQHRADSAMHARTDSIRTAETAAANAALAAAEARVRAADAAPLPPVKERLRTLILTTSDSSTRESIRMLAQAHQAETQQWERKVAARDTLIGLQRLRIQQLEAAALLLAAQRDSSHALAGRAIEHTSRRPTLGSVLLTGASCAAAGALAAEKETAPAAGLGVACLYRLGRLVLR